MKFCIPAEEWKNYMMFPILKKYIHVILGVGHKNFQILGVGLKIVKILGVRLKILQILGVRGNPRDSRGAPKTACRHPVIKNGYRKFRVQVNIRYELICDTGARRPGAWPPSPSRGAPTGTGGQTTDLRLTRPQHTQLYFVCFSFLIWLVCRLFSFLELWYSCYIVIIVPKKTLQYFV